jgi:hypothetical protein
MPSGGGIGAVWHGRRRDFLAGADLVRPEGGSLGTNHRTQNNGRSKEEDQDTRTKKQTTRKTSRTSKNKKP